MNIQELIRVTRDLVGDAEHEGSTPKFDEDQVVTALNLAQCRLASQLHSTYIEAETAVDENGLIDFSNPELLTEFGVMEVDRVRTEEPSTGPDATITAPTTLALAGSPFAASVLEQEGATYLWTVAGGVLVGSRAAHEVSVTVTAAGKVFLACVVCLNGLLARGDKTVIVTAT